MSNDNLALHLKYRPKTFEEVIGNESTIESLKSILGRTGGEVRSFLLIGPSGCGKTTLARIIKDEMKCNDVDFYEFNSANLRGIDTIREISTQCKYIPLLSKEKIYLLDEAHKLTNDAQNAVLKILEDTPSHVRFILCTTEPDKLLKTVKTRCSSFQVRSLSRPKIMKLLRRVVSKEGVDISPSVLQQISEYCDGSPRQALVMLDQVIDVNDDELSLQTILNSTVDNSTVLDLCQKLLIPSVPWKDIADLLKKLDEDPEKVRYAILSYMSKVLLDSVSERVPQIIDLFSESWIYSGRAGMVLACYLVTKIDVIEERR